MTSDTWARLCRAGLAVTMIGSLAAATPAVSAGAGMVVSGDSKPSECGADKNSVLPQRDTFPC